MLPSRHRLTRSADFGLVISRGSRAAQPHLVVHALNVPEASDGPRVGLVVAKSVGNAVQRHRIARQLRHVTRDVLTYLDAGDRVVIRARPGSAGAASADLHAQLRRALRRLDRDRGGRR